MAELSENAKARIDSLSEQELRLEVEQGRASRFQREKYAYLKVRLAEIESGKERNRMREKDEKNGGLWNWRKKVEHHPLVFAATLIFIGFGIGYSVGEWTAQIRADRLSDNLIDAGRIEAQIEVLTSEHNRRLAELHAALREAEKEAVDLSHIESNQRKYVEAAQRIRESISEENSSFETYLNQLMRITDRSR